MYWFLIFIRSYELNIYKYAPPPIENSCSIWINYLSIILDELLNYFLYIDLNYFSYISCKLACKIFFLFLLSISNIYLQDLSKILQIYWFKLSFLIFVFGNFVLVSTFQNINTITNSTIRGLNSKISTNNLKW